MYFPNYIKISSYVQQVRADYGQYRKFIVCSFEYRWSNLAAFFFKPRAPYNVNTLMWELTGEELLAAIREISRQRFTKNHVVDVSLTYLVT